MKPSTTSSKFTIDVSDDRLVATLRVTAGVSVSTAEIMTKVVDLQIAGVNERTLAALLERRSTEALTQEIARGVPAGDDRVGKPEFRVPLGAIEGVAIVTVDHGQIIATLTTNQPGTPGRDVFGKPITPKAAAPFAVGRNLTLFGNKIIASAAGSLSARSGLLAVEPLLEIQDRETAPVNFDGDVSMKGGLNSGRVIRATGSLLVGGSVENADVRVKGSIQVSGGMVGTGRGRCLAGGDLWCRFISGSNLHVQGNVHVQSEVTNGKIVAFRGVNVPRGPISGGRIIANGGVKCLTLGNENGTPTQIEVGAEAALGLVASAAKTEIENHRRRAADVRQKIGPLMQQMKQLTHQQREKATELLAEASEAEDKAEQMASELTTRLEELRAHEDATIIVQRIAHAGVTIRINGLTTKLTATVKGPFTLSASTEGDAPFIVLTDTTSGKKTPLPTQPVQVIPHVTVTLPHSNKGEAPALVAA